MYNTCALYNVQHMCIVQCTTRVHCTMYNTCALYNVHVTLIIEITQMIKIDLQQRPTCPGFFAGRVCVLSQGYRPIDKPKLYLLFNT